jgi:hypothetical protein
MSLRNSIHNLKIDIKIGNVFAKFWSKNNSNWLHILTTTRQLTKRSCYQSAYSNYSFSSSSSSSCSPLPVAATSTIYDILWISHQDTLWSVPLLLSLSWPSAMLRYLFLLCFFDFLWISQQHTRLDQYISRAQPASFGRASLPFSDIFLRFPMHFSSRYASITTFLLLSQQASAVLRYRFLTFFVDFLWISHLNILYVLCMDIFDELTRSN